MKVDWGIVFKWMWYISITVVMAFGALVLGYVLAARGVW